ncbi:MAG: hypothetical protein AMJ55_08105 [Gammaproteobacteria bacterium SG8_15]|nr:MAG: hypothetical protein AMJ55_08105 [Gammaproteobacteria bacterium SG8_15]
MKMKVCSSCGYKGEAVNQCFESFLVDLFVWLIVGSVALMTGLLPLLAIPAAWTVYHIVRFKTKCPECGNLDMVSVNSSKGKNVLAHTHH